MGRNEERDYPPFRTAAAIARRQEGAIHRRQLRAAGFSEDALKHRLLTRQFIPLTRSVYALGHTRLGPKGALWVAHLATGGVIAAEHAAWARGLLPEPPLPVIVITPTRRRPRPMVRARVADLPRHDVVRLDGLPITCVARTLEDLPAALLARAMREARYLDLLPTPRRPRERRVHDRICQAPRHRVRSPFEHDVLEALDALGVPHPLVNHRVDGRERDLFFPAENLVVELDGGRAHRFADDRARDRELFIRTGATTLRFAHGDDPAEAAETVNAALTRLRTLG